MRQQGATNSTLRKKCKDKLHLYSLSYQKYSIQINSKIVTSSIVIASLLAIFYIGSLSQASDNAGVIKLNTYDSVNNNSANDNHSNSNNPEQIDTSAQQNSTKVNVDLKSTQSTNSNGASSNTTTLKINGQEVPVSQNGNVQQHISSNDGSTTVNISTNNSSTIGDNTN